MSKKFVSTDDFSKEEIYKIFKLADKLTEDEGTGKLLEGKTILFPLSALDKKEKIEDVIDSDYFVGYAFKKHLVEVQQAIICYLLGSNV